MFESQTFELILQRMLDRIPDSFDKREGSVIYDALAPAAVELQTMYIALDDWLNEAFANTASREYLIRRASEVGVEPYPATKAVMKAKFSPEDIVLTSDDRFNLGTYNYYALNNLNDGYYSLVCETAGSAPNTLLGDLTPINEIPGLEEARIVECLIYGKDEEETEAFRTRYFKSIKDEPKDGNVADYEEWCNGYSGIGNYKIYPLWNGPNTVKVLILDTENNIASSALIDEFQLYLDPGKTGLGNGVAPIGSKVTVTTGEYFNVNISATIKLAEGYTEVTGINEAMSDFLKSIRFKENTIHYFSIGCEILECECVDSISNLLVNGGTSDIELESNQIPKFESGTWTVATND